MPDLIPGATSLTLKVGDLAFSAWEMGEGPLVLCLHGFPDTARTWRRLLPDLAARGYRAVAVTLRGYEPSSLPKDGDYSGVALGEDVAGWLDALGVPQAHLVGHDWGASIAFGVAARWPDKVRSLSALAVPHPATFAATLATSIPQAKRSWYMFFFQMRGLSDALVAANDFAFIETLWRDWSPGWAWEAPDMAALKHALAQPGVLEAALGYYRAAFDPAAPRAAEAMAWALNPIRAPTLGLAGETDGCIGADIFTGAMNPALFQNGLDVKILPNAGHFLPLEAADAVNAEVIAFLDRHR